MDDLVLRAMLKWPDVPDAYGWLALDRRGRWKVRTDSTGVAGPRRPEARDPAFEPVVNPALNAFISRNYAADAHGRWYFQNGPQRVFVTLAYTPLVFRLADGGLEDHCGRPVRDLEGVWLDEEGSLLLQAAEGVGVLDDRDLASFAEALSGGSFSFRGRRFGLVSIPGADLEARFGFQRSPRPDPVTPDDAKSGRNQP